MSLQQEGSEPSTQTPSPTTTTSSGNQSRSETDSNRNERRIESKKTETPRSPTPHRGIPQLAREAEKNMNCIQKALDSFETDLNSRLDRLSSTLSKVGEK